MGAALLGLKCQKDRGHSSPQAGRHCWEGQCSGGTEEAARAGDRCGGHRQRQRRLARPAHHPVGPLLEQQASSLPSTFCRRFGAAARAGARGTGIRPRQGPPLHLGTSRASLSSAAPDHYHLHLCCLLCLQTRLLRMEAACRGHRHLAPAAICTLLSALPCRSVPPPGGPTSLGPGCLMRKV